MPPSSGSRRPRNPARVIEEFHLEFLEAASAQLPIADFVIKGGVNFRFFFASHRRSKDVDLDYLGDRFATFGARVEKLLTSETLRKLLAARQITLADVRPHKQTDTVRRWKLSLADPDVPDASSKIEFSNRGVSDAYELAAISTELAAKLRGRTPRLQHYLPEAAIQQKVAALVLRAETQPRDVFDLDHLFTTLPNAIGRATLEAAAVRAAIDRTDELSYDAYASTVADFLDEDVADVLGTEPAWADMQRRVVTALERWLEAHA